MKKIFALVAAGLTLVAATGCDREDNAASTGSDLKSITLTISGANLTKASATLGDGDGAWDKDAPDMTSYDVYFTDGSKKVLYAWRLDKKGDYSDAYTALASNNAVRFVGLTGVSAVYVVCNYDGDLLEPGDDLADLEVDLVDQRGLVENTEIVYVGGDTVITPINDENNEDVEATIWDTNSEKHPDEYYSQYYTAKVYIRPVISRLEIASIGVKTTGTYTETYPYNGETIYYMVEWEGFAPKLKGIYMSNFYGTLCPVTPTAAKAFETPTGDRITNTDYLWDEKSTGIYDTYYNADGVTLYSDSGNDLFDAEDPDDKGVAWYFNGSTESLCVPFNFLVPFDVTSSSTDGLEWYSSVTRLYPAWHFCFTFDDSATTDYKYTLSVSTDGTNYTEYAKSDYANDETLSDKLTANFDFPTILINDSGNYYANITEMLDTNGDPVDIESNTIYKMAEVIINPYNFSTSTKTEDAYNVVVYVYPVDYATVDVTPSFDAN